MAQGIVITRCYSLVSKDLLEDRPVRPSLFETQEEFEGRRSICRNRDSAQFTIPEPRANRPIIVEGRIIPILMLAHFWVPAANSPNPALGSETGGRRERL